MPNRMHCRIYTNTISIQSYYAYGPRKTDILVDRGTCTMLVNSRSRLIEILANARL